MKEFDLWFPSHRNVVISRNIENPNRLHALWIGLTTPLFNLPVMLWECFIRPMAYGLSVIFSFWLTCLIGGIAGNIATTRPATEEEIKLFKAQQGKK